MSEHRLSEILIERPREGMRISAKKLTGYRKHLDQLTKEASEDGLLCPYLIKPRNKSKYLSDHLGPLRRLLRSHVGQPWNEVYSKICKQMDTSTMAGQHVLSHVWQYVELHVELIDGIPHRKDQWGSHNSLAYSYRDQFYIHPDTGILCAAQKPKRRSGRAETHQDQLILAMDHQYHRINDIWYLLVFEEFPDPPTQYVRDVWYGLISRDRACEYEGRKMYAAGKRQCGKKEIRFILSELAKP